MDKEITGATTNYYLSPQEAQYARTLMESLLWNHRNLGTDDRGRTHLHYSTCYSTGLYNAKHFEKQMAQQGFTTVDIQQQS